MPRHTNGTGTPVSLTQVRVVDVVMRPVAFNDKTLREIVLRALWLTASCPGAGEASEALWRGGWLHTQDVATVDEPGSFVIRDRLTEVIAAGGEWVCILTLEGLRAPHPAVAEVTVVGVHDKKWHERPVAATVGSGAVPTIEGVNYWLRALLESSAISRYALLDVGVPLTALPRRSVEKRAIRTGPASDMGRGSPPAPAGTRPGTVDRFNDNQEIA